MLMVMASIFFMGIFLLSAGDGCTCMLEVVETEIGDHDISFLFPIPVIVLPDDAGKYNFLWGTGVPDSSSKAEMLLLFANIKLSPMILTSVSICIGYSNVVKYNFKISKEGPCGIIT